MIDSRRAALGIAAFLCTALAVSPRAALAQKRPVPGKLDVVLGTTAAVFPTPGVADFDAGFIDQPGMVVSVQARPKTTAWELRIRSDDVNLGGYGKPLSDLLWRADASTVWTPLSGTDQAVLQGVGDQDVMLYLRMRLDWATDSPDTYAAGLVFTIVPL